MSIQIKRENPSVRTTYNSILKKGCSHLLLAFRLYCTSTIATHFSPTLNFIALSNMNDFCVLSKCWRNNSSSSHNAHSYATCHTLFIFINKKISLDFSISTQFQKNIMINVQRMIRLRSNGQPSITEKNGVQKSYLTAATNTK